MCETLIRMENSLMTGKAAEESPRR
jgi:hypothetical protein